jgi:hypothetical protein
MPHCIARFQGEAEMSARLRTRLKQALCPHDSCLAVMRKPLSRFQTTILIAGQNPSSQLTRMFHDVKRVYFSTSIFDALNLQRLGAARRLIFDPMLLRRKCRAQRDLSEALENYSSGTNFSVCICSLFQFFATLVSATLGHLGSKFFFVQKAQQLFF